jgi:ORF6N domain-containing protein
MDFVIEQTQQRRKLQSIPAVLEDLIHVVRGRRVMFDADLASLYEVPTKALNQAFRRNRERFPEDFAFQLSKEDLENWRSQIVTSNSSAKMGLRRPPCAFTQEGIAMLSSILRSDRAVKMNIAIMRAFVRLRELMSTHEDIAARVEKLERGQERAASIIEVLVEDIDRLSRRVEQVKSSPASYAKRRIGFVTDSD